MAATYAALVSLSHLINQIMEHHSHHPIFHNKQQTQIESLQKEVSFLQHFLEEYSHVGGRNEVEALESRIVDAAYAAEDIIESHVVDTILYQADPQKQLIEQKNENITLFTSHHEKKSSNDFSKSLQKVIEDIDSIRKDVTKIQEKSRVEDHEQPCYLVPVASSIPPNTIGKNTTVANWGDDLESIMDKLTGQSSEIQILSIVGMGGIGKTTLARTVFEDPLIVECFYIRGWITVSQEYDFRAMLLGISNEIGVPSNERELESSEYHQLGAKLYRHLSGRRYLIIIDDIWDTKAWEKLKLFFPNNNNGSRVMATTRLSNVADSIGSSHIHKMNLLDENESWSLLRTKVFANDGCPAELKDIGKDIAKNCKGLPLSIVVIGGLLAKSEMTLKYWEHVAKDINQIVNSEDHGRWLKILYVSYSNLPIHLKPCFLYMGVYPEDCQIRTSELIKLWVAEGILKLNEARSLEEVAEECLKDLVERNLIFVREWGSIGKIKTCGIHDLLRDLCLREAQKERFLRVTRVNSPGLHNTTERRIVFREGQSHERYTTLFPHTSQSTQFIRSLALDIQWSPSRESVSNLKLLRVLNAVNTHNLKDIFQLVNLRYIKFGLIWVPNAVLSPMSRLWYLQILIFTGYKTEITAPKEIWEMPQLRHIMIISLHLPDPSLGGKHNEDGDFVMKNLQTLLCIKDFKCTDEILKRIPNIKKLSIENKDAKLHTGTSSYCFNNLGRLQKLQSLTCNISGCTDFFQNVTFPESLKKLTLRSCKFDWDDITIKVGSLPHLEKLRLGSCYAGAEWNTVEGKFLSLKYLEIMNIDDLIHWTTDSTHFPVLERLVLNSVRGLEEIPSIVGDTLQSIELVFCQSSAIASAKEILEEQQDLGNESFRLTMHGEVLYI